MTASTFHITIHLFQCPLTLISSTFPLLSLRGKYQQRRANLLNCMLCYSAISMLLLQIDWARHSDPWGGSWRLTHSHAIMESASHHSNPNATAHFHGLAEKQPSKQRNHTYSLERSSISEPKVEVPFQATALKRKGELVQKILEVKHHCRANHLVFMLLCSGSSQLDNCNPE